MVYIHRCNRCAWSEYMRSINVDTNLRLLNRCILSCVQGYRLLFDDKMFPKCVANNQMYATGHGLLSSNDGMYIFSITDSADLKQYQCLSFLSITPKNIKENHNMQQCSSSNNAGMPIRKTILSSYIHQLTGNNILSDDCFFCCAINYTFHAISLEDTRYQCFPKQTCDLHQSFLQYTSIIQSK